MRLKVLAAREGAISEVVKEARTKIKGLSSNAGTYKKLLVGLLVQGMARLNEPEAVVRCRQADAQAVKESLEAARTEYANAFKTNAPKLSLDSSSYLPPAPVTGDEADSWYVRAAAAAAVASFAPRRCCSAPSFSTLLPAA